jgi:hypothetical protein
MNKTLIKEVLELDFYLGQLIGWHMIGSLREGGSARLEFYDKLNISVRGHSRQIVWKDIWVFTNDRDIL